MQKEKYAQLRCSSKTTLLAMVLIETPNMVIRIASENLGLFDCTINCTISLHIRGTLSGTLFRSSQSLFTRAMQFPY